MPTQQVPLTSPVKGIVRAVPREGQPPETAWDGLNVLPYDRYGRKRLAQRGGLLRQFTQNTGNFIQGMIEAPNIVYPPNSLNASIYSINDLIPGPFTFMTPGTSGPYAYNGPTPTFNVEWDWTFHINYGQSCVTSGDPFEMSTTSVDCIMYWPLTNTASEDLILYITGSGGLGDSTGLENIQINASIWYGDPSLGEGSWTLLTTSPPPRVKMLTGSATTATVTTSAEFTIQPNGTVKITLSGGVNQPQTVTYPFTILNFPELSCYSVVVPTDAGGSNIVSTQQTFNITDL